MEIKPGYVLERSLTVDMVDCISVSMQEYNRQCYRQEHRLKKTKYNCDYSVTLRFRLNPRWTIISCY